MGCWPMRLFGRFVYHLHLRGLVAVRLGPDHSLVDCLLCPCETVERVYQVSENDPGLCEMPMCELQGMGPVLFDVFSLVTTF